MRVMRQVGIAIVTGLCCFGVLMLSIQSAYADAQPNPHRNSTTNVSQQPSWVTQAMPYVHVTNYVAVIDSAIDVHMDVKDVAKVKQSVDYFNSLPLSARQPHVYTSTTSPNVGGCNQYVHENPQWWGNQWYFNDCAINTGILFGVTALLAPVPIQVIIGAYLGWLHFDSANCHNEGAFLNVPWGGPPWVSSIC